MRIEAVFTEGGPGDEVPACAMQDLAVLALTVLVGLVVFIAILLRKSRQVLVCLGLAFTQLIFSVCVCVCVSISPLVCLSIHLSVCSSISLFVCSSDHTFIYLSVRLSFPISFLASAESQGASTMEGGANKQRVCYFD